MPKFTVSYETRQQGAIGIFEIRKVTVMADTPAKALEPARLQLNQEGYETRFPRSVREEEEDGELCGYSD